MLTNVLKNLLYYNQFFLWIHYHFKFLCFYRTNIWHTRPCYVQSLHGCGWPFYLGLLNYLHHWLFQLFFFFPINITLCFPWLFTLEHLFFNCLTYCCKINIHHIHIYNDCLYFNNKLNFWNCHRFPMNHLLHLSQLLTI